MNKTANDFEQFLRWEEADQDIIKVKRLYVDIAEDIIAGLLLSQIIYWHLPSKRGKTKLQVIKEGQLWLVKGRDDWWAECRITARQFDRAIEILIKKNIVEKRTFRFNGSPTVHIRLVADQLLSCVNSILRNGENEITNENFDENNELSEPCFNETVKSNSRVGDVHLTASVKTLTETTTEITTKEPPPTSSITLQTKSEEAALSTDTVFGFDERQSTPTDIKKKRHKNQDTATIPCNEIVALYHEHCPSLPRVLKVTDARKKQIAARWKDNEGLDVFADFFKRIEKSDFLTNRSSMNRNGWICTFDWALNDQNMTKVLEGRYDNKVSIPVQAQTEPQYSGWGHNVPDYVRQIVERSAQYKEG